MIKQSLRTVFGPILRPLEQGDEPFAHKPLNRKILIAVGVLFMVLCGVAAFFALNQSAAGYIAPALAHFAKQLEAQLGENRLPCGGIRTADDRSTTSGSQVLIVMPCP